jgi:hypothetical protein
MVRCVARKELSLQDPRPVVRQIFQVLVFCISERSDQSLKHVETSQETITLKKSVNIGKSLNDLVAMVKNFFNYVPYVRSQ